MPHDDGFFVLHGYAADKAREEHEAALAQREEEEADWVSRLEEAEGWG